MSDKEIYDFDRVNEIAKNLRERYKRGFPILKELVQNADDAKATALIFGHHSGLSPRVQNPLLKGPALWILNNGGFKPDDAKSIRAFGFNAKAADSGAIGKFGLGMKSVFHLCEAFFYVANDGVKLHHKVLSPWFGINEDEILDLHKSWGFITEQDKSALNQVVDEVIAAHPDFHASKLNQTWFLLWIPLRRREHVPVSTAPIIAQYPGDTQGETIDLDFLNDPNVNVSHRLGHLLPLLRTLERVSFLGTTHQNAFSLALKVEDGTRRLDHKSDSLELRGWTQDGRPKPEALHFSVSQQKSDKKYFFVLQKADAWPKSMTIVDQERVPEPDKAQAEGAVMISHAKKRNGKLIIQWAVFLPTDDDGDGTYRVDIPGSSTEFHIVLHAQFFVDSGRRGIEGMNKLTEPISEPMPLEPSASELPVLWNKLLAQRLVLPMLLPALDKYVNQQRLGREEINALVKAISESRLSNKDLIQFVCADHVFVQQLAETTGPVWRLQPLNSPIRLLPLPPPKNNDHSRPWVALPGLCKIKDVVYVDGNAPRIARNLTQWNADFLVTLINSLTEQSITTPTSLNYLVEFLQLENERFLRTDVVQVAFVQRLRQLLLCCSLDSLRQHREIFRRLIALIDEKRIYALGAKTAEAKTTLREDIFRRLLTVDNNILLLPADLTYASNSKPELHAVERWLEVLDAKNWPNEHVIACLSAAEDLLNCLPKTDKADLSEQFHLLKRNPDWLLIKVWDIRQGQEVAKCFNDIKVAKNESQLFRITDPTDRYGYLSLLVEVLPNSRPLVLSSKQWISWVIGNNASLPDAKDINSIIRSIGNASSPPSLNPDESPLKELVGKMVFDTGNNDKSIKKGIRYLLHRCPAFFDDVETTLWYDNERGNSAWVKIWQMNLPEEKKWTVLSEEMIGVVHQKMHIFLGVKFVIKDTVITQLRTAPNFLKIDPYKFTSEDIDTILSEFGDQKLWRDLPLHQDQNGQRKPLGPDAYFGKPFKLPEGVGENLRFIQASNNPQHLEKQKKQIKPWNESAAIEHVLLADSPHFHWSYVLDIFPTDLSEDAITAMREMRWLPLQSGNPVGLNQLFSVEKLNDDFASLLGKDGCRWVSVGALLNEVKEHKNFQSISPFILTGKKAFFAASDVLKKRNYFVGSSIHLTAELLRDSIKTLAELEDVIPAWRWVQRIMEAFPDDVHDILHDFLPNLQHRLPSRYCEQVMNFIACNAGNKPLSKIGLTIFGYYLKEWVNSDSPESLKNKLPDLRLVAEDGIFLRADLLVAGVHGAVPSSCLHHELVNILDRVLPPGDKNHREVCFDIETESTHVPHKPLSSVLENWAGDLSQTSVAPAVGALMGLFGLQAREVARQWLKPIAYDVFLEKLNWRDPGFKNGDIRDIEWMGGKSVPEDAFKIILPRLKIQDADHVQAFNIIGQTIDVNLVSNIHLDSLLAGSLVWLGGYNVEITLRPVESLLDRTLADQKRILKLTAEKLYSQLYNQRHVDFSDLWCQFDQSDQVELNAATSLILDGLPNMLGVLPAAKKQAKIKSCLDAYDQARRDAASENVANSKKGKGRKQQKLSDLASLLKEDADVQMAVLLGVRERVKHNQYQLSSIPFEILQNADDAVGEYQEMQTKSGKMCAAPEDIGRFVLCFDQIQKCVLLMHWGRPINYTGYSTDPNIYNSDYAKDLEYMLMLGASGKSGDSETTTGKFGLGFKSVLLAADAPIVSSGDLQFQIVAGCLPVKATHSEWATVKKRHHPSSGRLRSTTVELSRLKNTRDVVQRFERLAGLCTVFLRHVRHIHIESDAAITTHEWKPVTIYQDELTKLAWCEMGKVQLPTEASIGQADSMVGMVTADLLVLRRGRMAAGESDGALAVRLAHGGVVPFADRDVCVPAIWVNAPTRGTNAQGFVLNAKFEVDTGRGSLPQGEAATRNIEVAKKLADDLLPLVQHWFEDTRRQWPDSAKKLNGLAASSYAGFWHSWWKTLMCHLPSADASADVKLADGFACRLFDRFVERTGLTPNGLAGGDLALVHVLSLCLVMTDAQRKAVLPALTKWPKFLQRYPTSGWCSSEARGWLERVGRCPESLNELSRGAVLGVLGDPARLWPEDVNDLIAIIQVWSDQPTNKLLWKKELEPLQLQNRLGEWKPLKAFCTWTNKGNRLAEFAPLSTLPDNSYEQQQDWAALVPFLADPTPSVIDVASWCRQAGSDDAKKSVLYWLLENQNHSVWNNLKYPVSGWMKQLSLKYPLLKGFKDEDRKTLLSKLGLLSDEKLKQYFDTAEQAQLPPVPEELTLESIHCWWKNERTKHIDNYDRGFWPQDIDRHQLNELPIDRSAWMTLFTLAVIRMFGRSKDVQHRGFIELLNRRGWWDTIAFTDPEADAQSWMDILREYAEGSEFKADYERWMDSFPRIYRMARWCEPYADLFCGLDRRDAAEARRLLTSSSDSSLSGSGFDAPTLHRTLKAGHPLVIRELLRAGVLKSSVAKRMAFTPSQAVKDFLKSIMGSDAPDDIQSSEGIFETLSLHLNEESATFFGDYDIPLIVLSRSTELQQHVAKVYGAAGLEAANDWGDEE